MCCFRRQNAWQPDWTIPMTLFWGCFHWCLFGLLGTSTSYNHPSRKNRLYYKKSHFEERRNIHSSWFLLWNRFPFVEPNLQTCIHIHKWTHLQYKIVKVQYLRTNRHTKIHFCFYLSLLAWNRMCQRGDIGSVGSHCWNHLGIGLSFFFGRSYCL